MSLSNSLFTVYYPAEGGGLNHQLDNQYLNKYNNTRPHSGKFCYGKTPMQTFKDSIKMAQDKSINFYLSDSTFAA